MKGVRTWLPSSRWKRLVSVSFLAKGMDHLPLK
jgi:hypothetical protein